MLKKDIIKQISIKVYTLICLPSPQGNLTPDAPDSSEEESQRAFNPRPVPSLSSFRILIGLEQYPV